MRIKSIIAALTALALGASLCGCSGGNAEGTADKPLVITTIFPACKNAAQARTGEP